MTYLLAVLSNTSENGVAMIQYQKREGLYYSCTYNTLRAGLLYRLNPIVGKVLPVTLICHRSNVESDSTGQYFPLYQVQFLAKFYRVFP